MMEYILKQAIKMYPDGTKFISYIGTPLKSNGRLKIKDKTIVAYFGSFDNPAVEVPVYKNGVWMKRIHELN